MERNSAPVSRLVAARLGMTVERLEEMRHSNDERDKLFNTNDKGESMTSRKYAYMNDFGVKSNCQRQGTGSELFKACVGWSKNKGATSLDLNVWEFNKTAISFYESFGILLLCKSRRTNKVFLRQQ